MKSVDVIMSEFQAIIDRQLGLYTRLNYDSILRRLVVNSVDSYYGLQNSHSVTFDHDPPIFACRFAEVDGYEHILALANEDGRVAIQDTSKRNADSSLDGFACHHNAVFDLAWMPRHMSFVTVSGDHTASLWDIQEGTPRKVLTFASHTKSVKTAVFQPHETSVFATGARDGHVLIWDVRAPGPALVHRPDNWLSSCHSTPARTPSSHSKRSRLDTVRAASITGLVFQDDRTLISSGECDGTIKVWDLRKNYNIYKREPLPKHSIPYCGSSTKNGYTNLIVDDARMRLYASCMDNVIYCFNISTYNNLPEQRYVGHENSTFYIKTGLSPDCKYLVSGSSDKNAYIWNVKYSEPVVKLVGHWAEVTCAAWCRSGHVKIVTASDDARHKIWRIGPELDAAEYGQRQGQAELVPHTDVTTLPHWGNLLTPKSLKRKQTTTPMSHNGKRSRTLELSTKKTKRCLIDMMNATKDQDENEVERKRLKLESTQDENQLIPAGRKRQCTESDITPEKKKCCHDANRSPTEWSYLPKAGSSFMTPTKNYEKKFCKKITPIKNSKYVTTLHNQSPVKSPDGTKVRIISFTTPTKNLPNYVLDGEAPHHRLMSPAKKRENINWLTRITQDKRANYPALVEKPSPLSPKENIPTRRNSTTDKTQKGTKTRTLLTYFNVSTRNK